MRPCASRWVPSGEADSGATSPTRARGGIQRKRTRQLLAARGKSWSATTRPVPHAPPRFVPQGTSRKGARGSRPYAHALHAVTCAVTGPLAAGTLRKLNAAPVRQRKRGRLPKRMHWRGGRKLRQLPAPSPTTQVAEHGPWPVVWPSARSVWYAAHGPVCMGLALGPGNAARKTPNAY